MYDFIPILLLYGFLQSGARLPVRDRVMGKVHIEPRPYGLSLLRLHVIAARHHNEHHILPDFFIQILRMNPVHGLSEWELSQSITSTSQERKLSPLLQQFLNFAHMVGRHHLHTVILIVNDAPVGIRGSYSFCRTEYLPFTLI